MSSDDNKSLSNAESMQRFVVPQLPPWCSPRWRFATRSIENGTKRFDAHGCNEPISEPINES